MKKWIIALSVVVLALAAVQIAMPPLARNYINSHGKELIGREVSVGKLSINIFTAALTARDIKIMEADGVTTFASADLFSTRIRIFPLVAERFIVRRILFEGMRIWVTQEGEAFNFDDIIAHFAENPDAAPAAEQSSWDVGIYKIAVRRSALEYRNLTIGSDFKLNHIDLEVPGFYLSGDKTDAGVKLDFPDGGSLASEVEYNMQEQTYAVKLALRGFSIESMLPYLAESMNVSELQGTLGANVLIEGSTTHAMDFTVSGDASLAGFDLRDERGKSVISADSIAASIYSVNLQKGEYLLRSLDVYNPASHFEVYADSTNNITALMRDVAESGTGEESFAMGRLLIERLAMHGGALHFADHTPCEAFHYDLTGIEVEALNFDPAARSSLTARATLNGKGTAKLHWFGSMADMADHDITFELHNVDMTHFTPYSKTMFGYPFAGGTLSFTSQNVIRRHNLTGTNHIDIFKPELAKKDKGFKPQYKVPLKTGIYLLTDRQGRMKLDVPVTGDLDSPQFSYRKIIINALTGTLVKVITSPVKFLAESLGISGAELIEIDPMQSELTSQQYSALNDIGKMLAAKPELRLSLTQRFNYEAALADAAAHHLRRAFFLRNNPAKAGTELNMLDIEAISAIDLRSKPLAIYADSLLKASGKPVKGDIFAKSKALYAADAETLVSERHGGRNSLVQTYMTSTLAVDAKTMTITTPAPEELRKYKGKSCYTISYSMADEAPYVPAEGEVPTEEEGV